MKKVCFNNFEHTLSRRQELVFQHPMLGNTFFPYLWKGTLKLREILILNVEIFRSSPSEVFLRKGDLKMCSKFTGEQPCWSATSIKLLCNFVEIALRHGCSPVNLLHFFRTPFRKNTSGGMFLNIYIHMDSKFFFGKKEFVVFCSIVVMSKKSIYSYSKISAIKKNWKNETKTSPRLRQIYFLTLYYVRMW